MTIQPSYQLEVQTINNSYSQTAQENNKPENSVKHLEKPAEQMEQFHKEIKEQGEAGQKELQPDNAIKATMLNQIMGHNVLQNIPTQEIMKLKSNLI